MVWPENFKTMKQDSIKEQKDLQQVIGTLLRWGVSLACVVAMIGGIIYLVQYGSDPLPDYTVFQSGAASGITWSGIWQGVLSGQAVAWILLGVIILIFTPVLRVFFSLITFSLERDWLYVGITAIVLFIILSNMLEGVGG